MKVMYQGKEIELNTEIEEGSIELDKLTPNTEQEIDKIDLDNTIEITDEELKKLKDRNEE